MAAPLTTIGFDADDTLWHNEQFFRLTEDRFTELLSGHGDAETVSARLLDAERRNLEVYGYGIKGFVLSMIETAIDVTDGRVSTSAIREILDAGHDLLRQPVETLPHVRETLDSLAGRYRLVLISKGDLFDQERKLAQSGLGEMFDGVEIVSEKTPATYERAFSGHGDGPDRAMMVGNSVRSDILPALEVGAWGVHVPYHVTWAHEHDEPPADRPRFRAIEHLGELEALLATL